MITSAFLDFSAYLLSLLLAIFPTSTGFSATFTSAFSTVGGYTAIINTLMPLDVLATLLLYMISFELIVFAWKGLRFLLGYVPAVGGKG